MPKRLRMKTQVNRPGNREALVGSEEQNVELKLTDVEEVPSA